MLSTNPQKIRKSQISDPKIKSVEIFSSTLPGKTLYTLHSRGKHSIHYTLWENTLYTTLSGKTLYTLHSLGKHSFHYTL